MQPLLETDILLVMPVHPVIDVRIGELSVKVKNPTQQPMRDVTVALRNATSSGTPAFTVTPSFEDGGYKIDTILAEKCETRMFCLRPIQAEVGRNHGMQAVLKFRQGDEGPAKSEESEAELREHQARFEVPVEARPEIYAAIGALESLRAGLSLGYEGLVKRGREKHGALRTVLPGAASVEPARVALSEGSFKFLLEAIELGTRILNVPAQRAKDESGNDQGGNSSP
ncbi:MAG: hypothetical protein ACE5I7_20295 [Candidatus Binatia bacterium]